MATTLLIVILAWAATAFAMLALSGVIGRLSGRDLRIRDVPGEPEAAADDVVVPLVPRARNGLVVAGSLRRAA